MLDIEPIYSVCVILIKVFSDHLKRYHTQHVMREANSYPNWISASFDKTLIPKTKQMWNLDTVSQHTSRTHFLYNHRT